jgi:hypothetical protein
VLPLMFIIEFSLHAMAIQIRLLNYDILHIPKSLQGIVTPQPTI